MEASIMFNAGDPPPVMFGWTGFETKARNFRPLVVPCEPELELLHDNNQAIAIHTARVPDVRWNRGNFESIDG